MFAYLFILKEKENLLGFSIFGPNALRGALLYSFRHGKLIEILWSGIKIQKITDFNDLKLFRKLLIIFRTKTGSYPGLKDKICVYVILKFFRSV